MPDEWTPADIEAFEEWMRPLLKYTHYGDGWFWHEYLRQFGTWPTPEMKAWARALRAAVGR